MFKRVSGFLVGVVFATSLLPAFGQSGQIERSASTLNGPVTVVGSGIFAPSGSCTASAIPYSFTTDTNTGIANGGADQVWTCAGGNLSNIATTTAFLNRTSIYAGGLSDDVVMARVASGQWVFATDTGLTTKFGAVISGTGFQVNSNRSYAWSNSTSDPVASADTTITRPAAGMIDVSQGGLTAGSIVGGTSLGLGINGGSGGTVTWTLQTSGNLQAADPTYRMTWNTGGTFGIPKAVNVTAQSAANASICNITSSSSDADYEVSGQVNVTASTSLATTLSVTYTDVSNTSRTMILPITQLSGSFIALGAITGTGAWESPVMHIRAKASTGITIFTSAGTFTSVTYSASCVIKQIG